jgi:hypothetical protein
MPRTGRFSPGPMEEGPIPAIHGVIRRRACDLIMRLYEKFGISVSDDTIYRLKHLSIRSYQRLNFIKYEITTVIVRGRF